MSKNDLAYNFLSGISLTNAPKLKEKHSTPSKNTLRESQAHFVSPTKTQPSVKTTHRDKEATSFLSSISLGGGEKEQEENVPAAPIERRRKTSGTHKRKDILSPKFVLKTYSKNPHNMRLLIANSKSAIPLYCFSLIKYNSEEIPQLKRKKSYENKIENQTSNSTTPAFNDQIEHKAISYDYLLGSSWINKANIDQNEEFSINNNQSLNSSSNINTINTSNNSTNSSNNTSNTINNISSSQYLPNQDVDFAYDPHFLDDPDLKTGKHRTVLNLPGFRGSIIPFITPEDLKEELNEQFRQKHSWIDHSTGVTLHKLRKLKRKLLEIALDKDLEPSTVALAYVFIDKLVLKNVIGKENLNLIGGVCLLLAIKFNDQKLDKQGVRQTLEIIEKYIEISPKEILEEEFKVFASLSFSLFVDPQDVMPHHQRLLSRIEAFKSDKEEE